MQQSRTGDKPVLATRTLAVQTRWSLRWMLSLCGILPALLGCDPGFERRQSAQQRAPIIGGLASPERSGVVRITHRDGGDICSGSAIAPDLVLTAKHCVFQAGVTGDEPLAADGFRVAFGPSVEQYVERYADRLDWIGMPGSLSVAEAVASGEDVALLHLTQTAPAADELAAVQVDYQPSTADELVIVGFGISSLVTGVNGTRLEAPVTASGFDPTTGVLQVSGPSACFGDSGGPVLLEPAGALVGVLGLVGGSSDASFCDIDLSFAATVANSAVRDFLRGACESAGGCGPRAGPPPDASRDVTAPDVRASTDVADAMAALDASPEAGTKDAPDDGGGERESGTGTENGAASGTPELRAAGGCNLVRSRVGGGIFAAGLVASAVAAELARRGRRSR